MSMKVQYDLDDIFALLICAEVYGFGDDILYGSLIKPLEVTKSHISLYVKSTYDENTYSGEEIEAYENILLDLFKMYS